jgi:hypothetical protein
LPLKNSGQVWNKLRLLNHNRNKVDRQLPYNMQPTEGNFIFITYVSYRYLLYKVQMRTIMLCNGFPWNKMRHVLQSNCSYHTLHKDLCKDGSQIPMLSVFLGLFPDL